MNFRHLVFGLAVSLAMAGAAQAGTVNFTNLGTFTTPELVFSGGTVTGSANVNVLNFNGLGIVGGNRDLSVDSNEQIRFDFTAPAINVSYFAPNALNGDGNRTAGDRFIEIFGLGGVSVGVFAQTDVGNYLLSDLVGAAIITGFSLTADGLDGFVISQISFDTAPSEVPLPAAAPLFLAALAGAGLLGRRRRQA
ncbi:MAG: hypothetical protein GC152_09510 [Alphaproteobacteria bacterium]|nr:hypothetical protein [Alphaproteobacteria bacterium]